MEIKVWFSSPSEFILWTRFFLGWWEESQELCCPQSTQRNPIKVTATSWAETSSFCENKLKNYCLGFVSFDKYQPHLWNCVSLTVFINFSIRSLSPPKSWKSYYDKKWWQWLIESWKIWGRYFVVDSSWCYTTLQLRLCSAYLSFCKHLEFWHMFLCLY